jgi:hypothetical protein
MYRYLGRKPLFCDKDGCDISPAPDDSPGIQIRVSADRPEESSYEYELHLSPEEVVKCLLTMPATSLVGAIRTIKCSSCLSVLVFDVIRHLAMGAIEAQGEDDESDWGQDTDSDEPEEEVA